MRRILDSATRLAALALASGLLSSCPGLPHHADRGSKESACPLPIAQAKGRFYETEEGFRVKFDAAGSFSDAFDTDGTVVLEAVKLFGMTGHHSAHELTDDGAYVQTYLTTILPKQPYWFDFNQGTTGSGNAWDGGPSYTLVVRHHYAHKETSGRWMRCSRDRVLHFDGIARTPKVDGIDDTDSGGTASHTATATCSGGFFGTMSYALYDGEVTYDQGIVPAPPVPLAIESYSSSARESLFDAANLFHTTPASELPTSPRVWKFNDLYDFSYSGGDTWYVGFRVIFADGELRRIKKFVGLLSNQGTIVPGQ